MENFRYVIKKSYEEKVYLVIWQGKELIYKNEIKSYDQGIKSIITYKAKEMDALAISLVNHLVFILKYSNKPMFNDIPNNIYKLHEYVLNTIGLFDASVKALKYHKQIVPLAWNSIFSPESRYYNSHTEKIKLIAKNANEIIEYEFPESQILKTFFIEGITIENIYDTENTGISQENFIQLNLFK